jgi:hypothetical protein
MHVFVLDKNRKPLDPCSPARARYLLAKGRAAVFRHYPFTIILKDRTAEESVVHPHRLKLDPGSKVTGLVVLQEGGRTKYNRSRLGLPKTHWLDAAGVGASTPEDLKVVGVRPLQIKACGHGRRNRCWTDRHGFPVRHEPRTKTDRGFRTGDIVEAVIPSGKYQGRHRGRVAIRFGQNFQVSSVSVHPRHLRKLHRADGYDYSLGETFVPIPAGGAAPPTTEARGFPPRRSL